MDRKLNCPLCEEEVISGTGRGCKMCGMPLTEDDTEFCSEKCMEKYKKIHSTITI